MSSPNHFQSPNEVGVFITCLSFNYFHDFKNRTGPIKPVNCPIQLFFLFPLLLPLFVRRNPPSPCAEKWLETHPPPVGTPASKKLPFLPVGTPPTLENPTPPPFPSPPLPSPTLCSCWKTPLLPTTQWNPPKKWKYVPLFAHPFFQIFLKLFLTLSHYFFLYLLFFYFMFKTYYFNLN